MTHVLLTGPIRGTVTLASGKEIDVRPDQIEVDPAEAAEIAHLIGERYAAEGHPHHDPDEPFVHIPHPDFADYAPHADNQSLRKDVI